MDWLQVGAFIVAVLGLGLAGMVYVTRQLNRQFDDIGDRLDRIESQMTRLEERVDSMEQWQARADERFDRIDERFDRIDERFDRLEQNQGAIRGEVKTLNKNVQNLEREQARMLGFLEGRGVMGKAPPEPERSA